MLDSSNALLNYIHISLHAFKKIQTEKITSGIIIKAYQPVKMSLIYKVLRMVYFSQPNNQKNILNHSKDSGKK